MSKLYARMQRVAAELTHGPGYTVWHMHRRMWTVYRWAKARHDLVVALKRALRKKRRET